MKKLIPLESAEHIAFADYLRSALPPAYVWWHTPNEGDFPVQYRVKLKRKGLRAGVDDFFIFGKGKLYAIEMKRTKGGRMSPDQIWFNDFLADNGAQTAVAHGAAEAIKIVNDWGLIGSRKEKTSTGGEAVRV